MLTDDAFMRLVAEDVKNKVTDEQRSYLRLPDNLGRWQQGLQALLDNLDDQIIEINQREQLEADRLQQLGADGVALLAEFQTDMEARRRKITRFRFYVENRFDESERLVAVAHAGPDVDARTTEFFRQAILQHQQAIADHDLDYSEVDEALWATLQGYWKFDSLVFSDD